MNFHRAKTYELIERISTGGMHGGMREHCTQPIDLMVKDWRSRASSGSVQGSTPWFVPKPTITGRAMACGQNSGCPNDLAI